MWKKIKAFLKAMITERVQGFVMGAAVVYPGLVEFLTSLFSK